MSEATENSNLFAEFEPVSKEEWVKKIEMDLKGKPLGEIFQQDWQEDFEVNGAAHQEDLASSKVFQSSIGSNPWISRQNFNIDRFDQINDHITALQNSGIQAIGLNFSELPELDLLIGHINSNPELDWYFSAMDGESEFLIWADKLLKTLKSRNIELQGGLEWNTFFLENAGTEELNGLRDLIRNSPSGFRILGLDCLRIHHKFQKKGDELSQILISAEKLLASLAEEVKIDGLIGQIYFSVGCAPLYFLEMAKLRALRLLWANILLHYDKNLKHPDRFMIHAKNSFRLKNNNDPYTNILQSTTIGMSALSGGVGMLSLDTSDSDKRKGEKEFQDIHRQIHHLLKYEGYFDKVNDPYRGSHYLENLTLNLAEDAWKKFKGASS